MSNQISAAVKGIRKNLGLTQAELAEIIGVTAGYVGMLEQGRAKPSYDVMEQLIKLSGFDANLFFETTRGDAGETSLSIVKLLMELPAEIRDGLWQYTDVLRLPPKENSDIDDESNT